MVAISRQRLGWEPRIDRVSGIELESNPCRASSWKEHLNIASTSRSNKATTARNHQRNNLEDVRWVGSEVI